MDTPHSLLLKREGIIISEKNRSEYHERRKLDCSNNPSGKNIALI